jgi:hypothetical protein
MSAALREAEFGNSGAARRGVNDALRLSSGRDVLALAALASARGGDVARAATLLRDLEKDYPANTILRSYWLPSIRAAIEIAGNNPARALDLLRAVAPYELGSPPPIGLATLYPVYLRGQAALLAHDGPTAASEFRKILDRPGLVLNFPLRSLALVNLARARAMCGDPPGARRAYEEFLRTWKDADPDVPLFRQAKPELRALR